MNRYLLGVLIGVLLTVLLQLAMDSLGVDLDTYLNRTHTVRQWFADLFRS
jgi:hypothetical protein